MLRRAFAILAICLISVTVGQRGANAQTFVLANCGAVPGSQATLTAGNSGESFVDTSGRLCVVPPFSRVILASFSFTPGTSYAVGNDMGGKFTLSTGLPANTQVQFRHFSFAGTAATLTASSGAALFLFGASPSTTFTDGASPTFAAADAAKIGAYGNTAAITAAQGSFGNTYIGNLQADGAPFYTPQTLQTDGSGNLYAAVISGGTWTMTTPGTFTGTVELGY